jgi:hypothetical protein
MEIYENFFTPASTEPINISRCVETSTELSLIKRIVINGDAAYLHRRYLSEEVKGEKESEGKALANRDL